MYYWEGNRLVVNLGADQRGISENQDQLKVEVEGIPLAEKENYETFIRAEGYLRDENGKNHEIDLGEVTRSEDEFPAKLFGGKAVITKKDAHSKENLTGTLFILEEWNGKEYSYKSELKEERCV